VYRVEIEATPCYSSLSLELSTSALRKKKTAESAKQWPTQPARQNIVTLVFSESFEYKKVQPHILLKIADLFLTRIS